MKLYLGDSEEVLKSIPENSVDSIVCDPPYGIHLQKRGWDKGLPSLELWRECWRVLKPGAYMMAMSSARRYHHLACLMEEAGFITHPMLGWLFGSGMPKSCNLARQMDQTKEIPDDAFRAYLRTSMKDKGLSIKKMNELCGFKGMFCHYVGKAQPQYPSVKHWELIKSILNLDERYDKIIHRNQQKKDLTSIPAKKGSLFQFRRKIKDYEPKTELGKKWQGYYYGLQSLKPALEPIYMGQKPHTLSMKENILAWSVGAVHIDACRYLSDTDRENTSTGTGTNTAHKSKRLDGRIDPKGRYPANVLFDGSRNVVHELEREVKGAGGYFKALPAGMEDSARFLYTPKPNRAEKGKGNIHPTVKPIKLMEYLIKLITPTKGTCLDPFMGSGSTGIAAIRNNFAFMGIEKEEAFFNIARDRLIRAGCEWYRSSA